MPAGYLGVDAPARDPRRRDADDLATHERHRGVDVFQRDRGAADLETAHRPWVPRDEVVDDEGALAVGLHVAESARATHRGAADDDVAGLRVDQSTPRVLPARP